MSRNPGIAKDWYDKYHTDVFPQDYVIHQGRKVKTPKYYDNQLEKLDPQELDYIKYLRQERAKAHAENNTPERLNTRERLQLHKLNKLERTL